jgi:hypothetical protein
MLFLNWPNYFGASSSLSFPTRPPARPPKRLAASPARNNEISEDAVNATLRT